jgi:hypothetical protein
MFRRLSRWLPPLLLALTLSGALAGCRREVVAPGDPVAAVKGLAAAVRDNDLVRYSRLSVPPALHARLEQRWTQNLDLAAPPTAKQRADYARWMLRFTEKNAESKLYASFDRRMKRVEADMTSQWPLMKTTGGIFLSGMIQANPRLSPAEKDHAKALGTALLDWLKPALLADRVRARRAIGLLVDTARDVDLPTLESSRQLRMVPALETGGRILEGLKQVGQVYGLDANAALARVEARVVDVEGDVATMEVSYPMLGRTIRFPMQLLRRDGRWYSADAVRQAEAELAQAPGPKAGT